MERYAVPDESQAKQAGSGVWGLGSGAPSSPHQKEKPRWREGLRVEAVEDGLVVQAGDGGAVHLLNRTAAFLWERCDGTHTAAEMAAELASATGAEAGRVAEDVEASLADLRHKGLLA